MYYLSVFLFNEEGNSDSYLHLGSCNMETGFISYCCTIYPELLMTVFNLDTKGAIN